MFEACAVTADLNRYEAEQDRLQARDEAIDSVQDELRAEYMAQLRKEAPDLMARYESVKAPEFIADPLMRALGVALRDAIETHSFAEATRQVDEFNNRRFAA